MKGWLKAVLTVLVTVIASLTVIRGSGAIAADLSKGAQVFSTNCAACHLGGGNVVNAAKTLKNADLTANQMNSIEAITHQVTQGKNAMPAFAGRLTPDQIADVAAYVLDQSEKGW